MKRISNFVLTMTLSLLLGIFLLGCGPKNSNEVYLLNFKPEEDKNFKEIAKKYTEETGKNVKVQTAASNQYESTLQAEILKSSKPTIFVINGPIGYESWKDYTLELSDTEKQGYNKLLLYDDLLDSNLAIKANGGTYAIPIAIEGYGLVYNKEVFGEYFKQENRASKLSSIEEVNSFDELKVIVEDLTMYIKGQKECKNANQIKNLSGVFTSTSLKDGSYWPSTTHLMNMPMYYEFLEASNNPILGGLSLKEISFKYNNEYKNVFDLYINNSVVNKSVLGDKSYDDSVAEFATGKAAIIQQGNWVYNNIKNVSGNIITESKIGMIPIYTGNSQEGNTTIATGTENYWCLNKEASKEAINGSIDFLNWLFTGNGRKYVSEQLGFISPFKSMESYQPNDPLAKEVIKYTAKEMATIPWVFGDFPSEKFKNDFGGALLEYVQGKKSWDNLVETVKNSWKKEAS